MSHSSTGMRAAEKMVRETAEAGLAMQTVQDVVGIGRHVNIDGQKLLNFGSCSYLALELRQELKRGAIEAVERFGTQFSFSRVYLQLPLYELLEDSLSEMTGGYALAAPSTTLGHIATLPVMVEDGDAVIIDRFAHASLHLAISLLRSIPVHVSAHNRMDLLEEKIAQLAPKHRRVWYVFDGLYSMLGDFAPVVQVARLLEKYPNLHLYVDDAHSTSWTGTDGRGYALERLPDRTRVIVALSLNKAFAAGGGAVVFSNPEDRLRVRQCGGPMLFSGPLQPSVLGAGVASAKLQLRHDFAELQARLIERITLAHALARDLGITLGSADLTPIVFVCCGHESLAFELTSALRQEGFYVCLACFPAVPKDQAGIRFTLSLHNTAEDITRLMTVLAKQTRPVKAA
jgi:7-keto-8-aminopelargonate synthetase-like enzyme